MLEIVCKSFGFFLYVISLVVKNLKINKYNTHVRDRKQEQITGAKA